MSDNEIELGAAVPTEQRPSWTPPWQSGPAEAGAAEFFTEEEFFDFLDGIHPRRSES